MIEEVAVTILGLALKLYPEIAKLVATAHASGAFPQGVADAVAKAMPTPGPAALALREIQGMP